MYNPSMFQNPYQQAANMGMGMNPYHIQPQYAGQQINAQRYEIIRVNGENGANAFQMAPNSSVLLLDESAPIIWFKTTDGAGYPTTTPYAITPYKPNPPVDVSGMEARLAAVEESLKNMGDRWEELTNGSKSNTRSAQSKQTGRGSGEFGAG